MEKVLVEEVDVVDVADVVDAEDVVDVEDAVDVGDFVDVEEGLTSVDEDVADVVEAEDVSVASQSSKKTFLEGFLTLPRSWRSRTRPRRPPGRTRRTWGGPTELTEATKSAAELAAAPEATEIDVGRAHGGHGARGALWTNLRLLAELAAAPKVVWEVPSGWECRRPRRSSGRTKSARSAVDDVRSGAELMATPEVVWADQERAERCGRT